MICLFEMIRSDFARSTKKRFNLINYLLLCLSSKGVAAVKDYRLSHYLWVKGMPMLAKVIKNRNIKKHGCDIGFSTKIGPGFAIGHPVGVVISGGAEIGENFTVMSCVTIGAKGLNDGGAPKIGDNVYIGTGAKVLGKISIGNNSCVGANSVVTHDVDENTVVAGVPATKIRGM